MVTETLHRDRRFKNGELKQIMLSIPLYSIGRFKADNYEITASARNIIRRINKHKERPHAVYSTEYFPSKKMLFVRVLGNN